MLIVHKSTDSVDRSAAPAVSPVNSKQKIVIAAEVSSVNNNICASIEVSKQKLIEVVSAHQAEVSSGSQQLRKQESVPACSMQLTKQKLVSEVS